MKDTETSQPPNFTTNRAGKPTKVILTPENYIRLLGKANETNPSFWPPGSEEGAAKLKRLRQIESEYQPQEGRFDWESLPAEIQDEYDGLSIALDLFQEPSGNASWDEYQAKRKGNKS